MVTMAAFIFLVRSSKITVGNCSPTPSPYSLSHLPALFFSLALTLIYLCRQANVFSKGPDNKYFRLCRLEGSLSKLLNFAVIVPKLL